MFTFISKRLLSGLAAMIAVVILISAIIYMAPVDPARLTFGQRLDASSVELKKKQLGLDQPLFTQLRYYLRDISPIAYLKNDFQEIAPYPYKTLINVSKGSIVMKQPYFRTSFQTNNLVSKMVKEALPNTLILAFAAIFLASIIGIFLGVVAAFNNGNSIDSLLMGIATIGYSVPSYVSAIFMSIIFGYLLHSFTGLNMQGSIRELNDIGDEVFRIRNLILPAIALGVRPVAVIMQLTRSAMLVVLSQDYIRTAISKGLSFKKMLKKHAFKNAINPVATAISGWFASLLSGAFFVENVFNFNGLGQLTVNALLQYDIPVLLACIIITASFFIVINILMDIFYLIIDPRVKIN